MYGGSPNPDDFNKPTEVEKAETQVAVRNFNEYLNDKPVIAAYLADISRDPEETAKAVKGEASADLAQKTRFTPGNPNGRMNPSAPAATATLNAKVMSDIDKDAISQQAAAKKVYVENAMGIQSSANTAQQGMARDAVSRNITDAEGVYNSNAATNSSIASLAGTGAGMMYAKTGKDK